MVSGQCKFKAIHSLRLRRYITLAARTEASVQALTLEMNRHKVALEEATKLGVLMPNTKQVYEGLVLSIGFRKSALDLYQYLINVEVSALRGLSNENGQKLTS